MFKTTAKVIKNPGNIKNKKVKERDESRCLCCGEDREYLLEVDHINPKYFGGTNSLDNLQTLCRYCNTAKGTREIDFRLKNSLLPSPLPELPVLKMPFVENAGDINYWKLYLTRIVNFFYQCSAVKSLNLENDKEWKIVLKSNNDPSWIEPHLNEIKEEISILRKNAGLNGPERIIVN